MGSSDLKSGVVLSANPDGILAGTRCNARGVDLNRNYPTSNWSPDPVFYRNQEGGPQNIALSPGAHGASEPETLALIDLIKSMKLKLIISFHGYLGCIDDPQVSPIAKDIARRSGLDLVPDVGYATPGSFGSWCLEEHLPIITYEFPPIGIVELRNIHRPIISDILNGSYTDMLQE